MKADGLFVIMAIVFVFIAWVASGGPNRPIAREGLFITPVARSGEEPQGYSILAPANPVDASSYPKQIGGAAPAIASSTTDAYTRRTDTASGNVYIERGTTGPAANDPNEEYVTLVNGSASSVSLTGWRLVSAATGAALTVPSAGGTNVVLAPQAEATLITGRPAGQSFLQSLCSGSSSCFFLGRGSEAFAPARETIRLFDQSGRLVDSFSY